MPQDTSWGMRPTYAHPAIGAIAENPLVNLLQDSRRIVQDGPNALDIALLGLSAVPAANVPINAAASKIGTAYNRMLDKPILMSGHKIPNTFRYILRNARERAALNKLEETRALEQSNLLARKAEERRRFSTKHIPVLDDVIPTGSLPENVTRIGEKPIKEMTWDEFDSLNTYYGEWHRSIGGGDNFSPIQYAMMRTQRLAPDDVLTYFWDKGARKTWTDNLSAIKSNQKLSDDVFDDVYQDDLRFVRERDLKSGWAETKTDKQLLDDIAWKKHHREALGLKGDDPIVSANKYSLKPDDVDGEYWLRLTRDMTMKEVENAARRHVMRLIK